MLPGELHLSLRGVDVHVHRRHRQGDGQDAAGELTLHDLVAVALLQRRRQQLGLDEPAVDEEHLHGPGAPAHQRRGDKTGDRDVPSAAGHRHQPPGEVPAQGSVDGGVQLSVAGGQQGLHPVLDELEGDVRMGQGQMLHEAVHRRSLRTVLAHKLQPGGGVVKQVPDRDGGALRRTGGLHCAGHTALQMEGGSLRRAGLAGEDVHPADGGDGGQGLAPEPQSADLPQVLLRPQLGGGVAQEGGGEFLRRDAAAVVRHPDHAHAAPADLHHHGRAAGVDGVFHQLLHHAGGPLHDLTGGDQVRYVGLQLLNVRHIGFLSKLRAAARRRWEWSRWTPPWSGR